MYHNKEESVLHLLLRDKNYTNVVVWEHFCIYPFLYVTNDHLNAVYKELA